MSPPDLRWPARLRPDRLLHDRLLHDRRGLAAVEFALVAPFLVLCIIGVVEATQLLRVQFKVSQAAESLANMVAQQASVTRGTGGALVDACTGAALQLTPFQTSLFAAEVASVSNSGGTVKQLWSDGTSCPTAGGTGSLVSLATQSPSLVPNANDSVIVVSASYAYQPVLRLVLPRASYTITQTAFARPRGNAPVICTNCP